VAQQTRLVLGRLTVEVSISHTIRYTKLAGLSEQVIILSQRPIPLRHTINITHE